MLCQLSIVWFWVGQPFSNGHLTDLTGNDDSYFQHMIFFPIILKNFLMCIALQHFRVGLWKFMDEMQLVRLQLHFELLKKLKSLEVRIRISDFQTHFKYMNEFSISIQFYWGAGGVCLWRFLFEILMSTDDVNKGLE